MDKSTALEIIIPVLFAACALGTVYWFNRTRERRTADRQARLAEEQHARAEQRFLEFLADAYGDTPSDFRSRISVIRSLDGLFDCVLYNYASEAVVRGEYDYSTNQLYITQMMKRLGGWAKVPFHWPRSPEFASD